MATISAQPPRQGAQPDRAPRRATPEHNGSLPRATTSDKGNGRTAVDPAVVAESERAERQSKGGIEGLIGRRVAAATEHALEGPNQTLMRAQKPVWDVRASNRRRSTCAERCLTRAATSRRSPARDAETLPRSTAAAARSPPGIQEPAARSPPCSPRPPASSPPATSHHWAASASNTSESSLPPPNHPRLRATNRFGEPRRRALPLPPVAVAYVGVSSGGFKTIS